METNEFEKLMSKAPERADKTKIIIDPGTDPGTDPGKDPGKDPGTDSGKDPGTDPGTDPGKDPGTVKMSIAQFGATITGIYTAVSDFVYKRIKGTDTAPAWTETDRETLNNAMLPVMQQYNVTLTPTTNLIITIAVIEAMRYAKKTNLNIEDVQNER